MKLETLQAAGSFKLRGALNKLLALSAEERGRGVVAASTGNHGIAVAEAGAILTIPVTVFVPDLAAPSKLAKMTQRGAQVTKITGDPINAEKQARRTAEETGRPYVSPYNDAFVIAGQAPIALELARQCPSGPDVIFVPVGGGGLAAGIAIGAKSVWPKTQVIGCSPLNFGRHGTIDRERTYRRTSLLADAVRRHRRRRGGGQHHLRLVPILGR